MRIRYETTETKITARWLFARKKLYVVSIVQLKYRSSEPLVRLDPKLEQRNSSNNETDNIAEYNPKSFRLLVRPLPTTSNVFAKFLTCLLHHVWALPNISQILVRTTHLTECFRLAYIHTPEVIILHPWEENFTVIQNNCSRKKLKQIVDERNKNDHFCHVLQTNKRLKGSLI